MNRLILVIATIAVATLPACSSSADGGLKPLPDDIGTSGSSQPSDEAEPPVIADAEDAMAEPVEDDRFDPTELDTRARAVLEHTNWLPLGEVQGDWNGWLNNPSADHDALWDEILELTIYSDEAAQLRDAFTVLGPTSGWVRPEFGHGRMAPHGFVRVDLDAAGEGNGHYIVLYATGMFDADGEPVRETWAFPFTTNADITRITSDHPPIRSRSTEDFRDVYERLPDIEDMTLVGNTTFDEL